MLAFVCVNVCDLVFDFASIEPLLELLLEALVGAEVFAPKSGVFHAGFGQRAVEIEHTDEARPCAAPVGHGEDGAFVRDEAVQQVVRILPDGFGNNEGCLAVDRREDIHALALARDEAVLQFGVVFVRPFEIPAEALEHGGEFLLHLILLSPAVLIGGEAKVAVGDEEYCFIF